MASSTRHTLDRIPPELVLAIAVAKLGGELTISSFELQDLVRDPEAFLQQFEVMDPPAMVWRSAAKLDRFKPAKPAAEAVKLDAIQRPDPLDTWVTDHSGRIILKIAPDGTLEIPAKLKEALKEPKDMMSIDDMPFRPRRPPPLPGPHPARDFDPLNFSPTEVGIGIVLSFAILGVAKLFGLL